MTQANLVAIQVRAAIEDYENGETFRRRMEGLMEKAAETVDFSKPSIVCFPETIGLWLSFVPEVYKEISGARTIQQAIIRGIPPNLGRFLRACWRFKTVGVTTIFLETALEAEAIYRETFADLAKKYNCYIQSGTIYVPMIEDEPVKGRHVPGRDVYNIAYLFNPHGVILQRVPKHNLSPPLEHKFHFASGDRLDIHPVNTTLGRLGILICYDGFHETLVEHYDSLDVEIVLNPSHSDRNWEQPAGFNNAITVGEAWERHGVAAMIQGRPNIKYAVVSMMAGRVLDLEGQGCSHIAFNCGEEGAPSDRWLMAKASSHTAEEIISAEIELPPQAQRYD